MSRWLNLSPRPRNVDDFDPRKANVPILPFWAVGELCWIKDKMQQNRFGYPRTACGLMTSGPTEMMAIATAQELSILRDLHARTRQAHGVAT